MKMSIVRTLRFALAIALMVWTTVAPPAVHAQSEDDEVMISDCEDVYEFVEKDGGAIVRNRITTNYQSLRKYLVHIQPATFYGDFVKLDGSSGKGSAQYRSATPENVFFDDSKVCFYDIEFKNKNTEARVSFSRTFTDPRYFSSVLIADQFFIRSKRVRFIIPDALSRYELVEKNFDDAHIQKAVEHKDGNTIITYAITDMKAMKDEENRPPTSKVYPCILIKGAFADWQDMFAWSRNLSAVDTTIPNLSAIIAETGPSTVSALEKVSNTLAWVQRNIRYVAFEAGISGHQPEKPAEVVRKKYGDCKGMALLLKTLLKAQGIDARLTDVGTTDVPCRMGDVATLASVNHAICTAVVDGRNYYLDATNKYIPYTYIPSSIQGQQAMIEEGEDGRLVTLPMLPAAASTDSMAVSYTISDGQLVGKSERWVCGDMKQSLLSTLNGEESTDRATLESRLLMPGNLSIADVTNLTRVDDVSQSEWTALKADIRNANALQQADGELYVELNPMGTGLFATVIDTLKRQNDFVLPFASRIVREVRLQLPADCQPTYLPEPFSLTTDNATLHRTVTLRGRTIIFRKWADIRRTLIPRNDIPAWNAAIRQWREACSEQVVIAKR